MAGLKKNNSKTQSFDQSGKVRPCTVLGPCMIQRMRSNTTPLLLGNTDGSLAPSKTSTQTHTLTLTKDTKRNTHSQMHKNTYSHPECAKAPIHTKSAKTPIHTPHYLKHSRHSSSFCVNVNIVESWSNR